MTIEVSAKKVEDAISQGLAQLGATADEVNVEVIDLGGLFRKAKVRLTLEREEKQPEPQQAEPAQAAKPEPQQPAKQEKAAPKKAEAEKPAKAAADEQKPVKAAEKTAKKTAQKSVKAEKPVDNDSQHKTETSEETSPRQRTEADKAAAARAVTFIQEIVSKMGFAEATVQAGSDDLIEITAPPHDDSLLIGRHGETLSALSYIAETCARAEKCHINVTVDCNGYRERRAASLTSMAKRRANECVAKNRKIKLEAMERIDRRTIHNALTGDERVTTASEGKEPYRYVVILPKK